MGRNAIAPQLDWNGDNGRRWLDNQDRLDRMLASYSEALLAGAHPVVGDHVLDVGCGAGASTFDVARRVGRNGRAVGLDISAPLIGRAREIAVERSAAVEFRLGDAAFARFEPVFDLIVSRFGVMFFEDAVAAFANLRGALKPTGRLVFVCWRSAAENDWTRLPMTAIQDIIPPMPAPDPTATGPFSFGDPDRVKRILIAAGFADIDIQPLDSSILFGVGATPDAAVDDAVEHAIRVGPLQRALMSSPEGVRLKALEAVRRAFGTKLYVDGVRIKGAAWMVSATSP